MEKKTTAAVSRDGRPRYGRRPVCLGALVLVVVSTLFHGSRSRADDQQQLGALLQELGRDMFARRYSEGEKVVKQVLELTETKFKNDDAVRFIAFTNIASFYTLVGRSRDAEPHLARALKLCDGFTGSEAQPVTPSLDLLALSLWAQHRWAEAERVHKAALRINQSRFGPNHEQVAKSLTWLGLATQQQNRYRDAEVYYRQALAIREKRSTPVDLGISLASLAQVCSAQGRFDEAEALAKRAFKITSSVKGAESPAIGALDMLSTLCQKQGRLDEAESYARQSLERTTKMALADKPMFIQSKCESLAEIDRLKGHLDQARSLLNEIVAALESAYGPRDTSLAPPLLKLARIAEDRARLDEAEQFVDRVWSIDEGRGRVTFDLCVTRAKLRRRNKKPSAAMADLQHGLELAEEYRARGSGSELDRAAFFERFRDAYETVVDWNVEDGAAAAAFDASERCRAQSLIDQMNLQGADLFAGLGQEQVATLRSLTQAAQTQFASLNYRLSHLARGPRRP